MNIRTKLLGGFLGVGVGLSAVLLSVNFQHDRDARDRSDQIAASAVNDRHVTLRALAMAVQRRCPEAGVLHHSDQGCTYASEDYQAAHPGFQNAGELHGVVLGGRDCAAALAPHFAECCQSISAPCAI